MRPLFRSVLVFLGGLLLSIGVPYALGHFIQPCRHLALRSLLYWSAIGTAVTYYLSYQLLVRRAVGRSLLRVGFLGAALCLFLSIALSNLFGAIGRSKQVKTMAALRVLGAQLAPHLSTLPAVQRYGPPDAWGNPILIATQPGRYVLVSFGECGIPDVSDPWHYLPGPTAFYNADVVYSNGQFLRYPEGIQQ